MKKVFILNFVLLNLFLCGCIVANVEQVIHYNGTTTVVASMNLSKVKETAFKELLSENPCEKFSETLFAKTFQNTSCEFANHTVLIKGSKVLTSEDGFIVNSTLAPHILFIFNTSKAFERWGLAVHYFTDEKIEDEKSVCNRFKIYGIKYTYTVKMPGNIISGDINESSLPTDTITLDYLDICSKGKDIVVIAELIEESPRETLTQNIHVWLIVVVILVLIVFFIAWRVLKRRA